MRASSTGGFGVLWMEAIGPFGKDIVDEIVATWFGSVTVPVTKSDGRRVGQPCYFFDRTECFDHPQLNALVAAHEGNARLLINPQAHRADQFRKSALVAAFAPGVVDPPHEVAKGDAFTLEDYVGPRAPTPQNDRPRRALLGKKYGLAVPVALRMHRMTIAKLIPVDELAARLSNAASSASAKRTRPNNTNEAD